MYVCVRDCDVRFSLWVIRLKEDQEKQFKPTQIRCDSNRCSEAQMQPIILQYAVFIGSVVKKCKIT